MCAVWQAIQAIAACSSTVPPLPAGWFFDQKSCAVRLIGSIIRHP